MTVDIYAASIDHGEKTKNASYQPTLWLTSAVEVHSPKC
jgi:hypothetical protein